MVANLLHGKQLLSLKCMHTCTHTYTHACMRACLLLGAQSSISKPILGYSRNSQHFMEPESSLPHSQVPTTCPYPEPDRSSPCPISHFLKIHLNIILSSMSRSPKWSLFFNIPTKTLYARLLTPYVLHALPISLFSI